MIDLIKNIATPLDEFIENVKNSDDRIDYIKKHTYKVSNEKYPGLCDFFFNLNFKYHGIEGAFTDQTYPIYNDVLGSAGYKTRFIVFDACGTYIYVMMKLQDNIGMRRYGIPLYYMLYGICSLNGDLNAERYVAETLMNMYEFRSELRLMTNFDKSETLFNYDFYAIPQDFADMNRSKWRSSHGINKLNQIVDVRFKKRKELTDTERSDITNLQAEWHIRRTTNKNITNTADTKMLDYTNDEHMNFILYYIGETLVGYNVLLSYDKFSYIDILKPVSSFGYERVAEMFDDDTAKLIHSYLLNYMIYKCEELCFVTLKQDIVFIGGIIIMNSKNATESGQDLTSYKQRLFKNSLKYYKYYNDVKLQ